MILPTYRTCVKSKQYKRLLDSAKELVAFKSYLLFNIGGDQAMPYKLLQNSKGLNGS